MHSQSDICIIGNGAVGKAAALGLAQAGLSVALLVPASSSPKESQLPESWDVRVYAFNHVAKNLLSSLKVWGAMNAARVEPVAGMIVKGDAESGAGQICFDAYEARTDALAWIVEDRNLNQALDAALRFTPGVQHVTGRAIQMGADISHATVTLDNGDTLSASLIIGADGGQSWVRGQCDIDVDYRPYGQRAIVTNFECEQPHRGIAYQWFTSAEGILALLPLPGDRVSLVWSAPDALANTLLDGSLANLAEQVTRRSEGVVGKLSAMQPETIKAFPLALLRPRQIVAPRVALIGDAAHVVHPLAGHGMNLGFGDVIALFEVIAKREAHRDCGDARVLGRYARARKEEVLAMQIATDGLERLFASDFEPIRLMCNLGLNVVDKLPFVKRRLVSQALGNISQEIS